MQHVIESGPDHPPFFVYLGPHAPHKPSTPAPWYADHPIGELPLIKGPYYNYFGKDKHIPLSLEPENEEAKEEAKQWASERKRLQSAADEASKRAEQSQRALSKAQQAVEALEAAEALEQHAQLVQPHQRRIW